MLLSPQDIENFWQHGYMLAKSVIPPEEAADLRQRFYESKRLRDSGAVSGDLLTDPVIGDLVLDDRLLNLARQVLGAQPVYFGDAGAKAIAYDIARRSGFPHRDNVDRLDPDGPDWGGRYNIVRFAFYLQDHSTRGGGLGIHAGSHRFLPRNRYLQVLHEDVLGPITGTLRSVPSMPGDVVVWTLRTMHTPYMRHLFGIHRLAVPRRWQSYLPNSWLYHCTEDRVAAIITFGARGDKLSRYLSYLKTRTGMVKRLQESKYSPEIRARAQAKGLDLVDFAAEVREDIARGVELGREAKWSATAKKTVEASS